MTNFLINYLGVHVYYDLESCEKDEIQNIKYDVKLSNGDAFYVRLHREDAPALIGVKGSKHYYQRGKKHCEDGPAAIWHDGVIQWLLNGKLYSFKEWCEQLNKSEEEINFIKLKWNII